MSDIYDVYYTTGGGPWVNSGTDIWVNQWIELISPKLKVKPILLIHRNKPSGSEYYKFPIETYWHGDDIDKFNEICSGARRIHILHGHYIPTKAIISSRDKIYSNVIHNSVYHILKSQVGSDLPIGWTPYMNSSWETSVNKWAKYSIWVGLYKIPHDNINITNFYEFKNNSELSNSNIIGFASRSDGRKNPHFLDKLPSYIYTNSREFNHVWKNGVKLDLSKSKIFHYYPKYKRQFYNMDWGISHSAFRVEPFGYSIFESVDYGKLPILYTHWCSELDYPYRASNKKEFRDIYNRLCNEPYEVKLKWFNHLKKYMVDNYTDKQKWITNLLNIYNE